MADFSKRSSGMEIMDDLQRSGDDLHQALRELDTINYLLGGNRVTLNGIHHLLPGRPPVQPLHIVDVGCGSGDLLRLMRKLLDQKKVDAILTGIDANPNVIDYAVAHTPASCRIHYRPLNIFSEEFKMMRFDIITGTLFFHHFTTAELVVFFKQLTRQAAVGLIVNDIHRHWFAYYSIQWLTRLFSRSRMVKHDAAQSVLRAFTKRELAEILCQSGIDHFRIRWQWAFRWQVIARF